MKTILYIPILAHAMKKKKATTAALRHLEENRAGAQYFSIATEIIRRAVRKEDLSTG